MTSYIIRRLFLGIVVIFIVTVMVFLFIRLLPGDPLTIYLNKTDMQQLTEEQLFELRVKFGLEKSLPMQYVDWIAGLFKGDMGQSVYYDIDVRILMTERLPVTLYLGALAFVFSGVLGIFFGVICALKRGTWLDTLVTLLANIGVTMPSFWVGIILIYLITVQAGWLPSGGFISPFENFWESTRRVIMPVTCLALFPVASLARLTRSSMLEVTQQDYVRTAWSKGLKERLIVSRHVIKNALIPVITVIGVQVAFIFGGSVLIESVFNINGIGRLATQAVQNQDYQVVQAVTLIMAIMVVIANLIVDISYGWLDPRIRYD
jgi:peptide/nickel transport system permease protein